MGKRNRSPPSILGKSAASHKNSRRHGRKARFGQTNGLSIAFGPDPPAATRILEPHDIQREGTMNYAEIKYCDIANGVGVRTTLFVSGCRLHCPHCFNEVAWDFSAGKPFTREVEDQIIESLDTPYVTGLSVLGGEPMEPENQQGLVGFLERVRERFGARKSIWMYSGHTWEQLAPGGAWNLGEVTDRILDVLDVLVDGPFVQDKHDITLRFRGSSNQRLIDVPATLESAEGVVLWQDDPLFSTHAL